MIEQTLEAELFRVFLACCGGRAGAAAAASAVGPGGRRRWSGCGASVGHGGEALHAGGAAGGFPSMDSGTFARLCKRAGFVDAQFPASSVDIVFAGAAPRGQRRLDFAAFRLALESVALRKRISEAVVLVAVVACGAPPAGTPSPRRGDRVSSDAPPSPSSAAAVQGRWQVGSVAAAEGRDRSRWRLSEELLEKRLQGIQGGGQSLDSTHESREDGAASLSLYSGCSNADSWAWDAFAPSRTPNFGLEASQSSLPLAASSSADLLGDLECYLQDVLPSASLAASTGAAAAAPPSVTRGCSVASTVAPHAASTTSLLLSRLNQSDSDLSVLQVQVGSAGSISTVVVPRATTMAELAREFGSSLAKSNARDGASPCEVYLLHGGGAQRTLLAGALQISSLVAALGGSSAAIPSAALPRPTLLLLLPASAPATAAASDRPVEGLAVASMAAKRRGVQAPMLGGLGRRLANLCCCAADVGGSGSSDRAPSPMARAPSASGSDCLVCSDSTMINAACDPSGLQHATARSVVRCPTETTKPAKTGQLDVAL
eukprot:TRINITY_DN65932_c0_g1_i1.p1 TRINITY_DN65932_c0_g1~~TRINITY_DN65932_c0_g1_i1.p1  ORF type:complete len:545 (-),score=106.23 TRINITY_DN65932_c0_g1_i1:216-1850(-)